MAFVITVAQRKGGAGKTTLACHLASGFRTRGLSVLGLDLDPQKSFTHWGGARALAKVDEGGVIVRPAQAHNFAAALHDAPAFDVVVIDTPPTVDPTVGRSIRAADLVLTPLQLSPIDLAASLPTAEAIASAGQPFLFVVMRAPPRSRVADAIRQRIKAHRIPCAKAEIGNRAAYVEAIARGLGVLETEPKSAAGREMDALVTEVLKRRGRVLKAA